MTFRPASPNRFIALYDQFAALPAEEASQLVEDNSGELYVVSGFWNECCEKPDTREYDPCDAAYIMLGLRDLHQLHYSLAVDPLIMPQLWDLALAAAVGISHVVNFETDYDFGVFCYEQLGTEPGELVYRVYYEVWQKGGLPMDVEPLIATYAKEQGWPLR